MFPHPIGDGVFLELVEPRHAEEVFRAVDRDREYLRRWLAWVDATHGPADTLAWIRASAERTARNDGYTSVIRVDGRIAGSIGEDRVDWRKRATVLGYWLGEEFQGRGIMTAAVRAYLGHAFATRGLNRVEIRCATDNVRSCAIPERLGFTREGVLREAEWLHGRPVDHAVYGLLAREWGAR